MNKKGKMIFQRIIGLALLVICVLIIIAAYNAHSPEEIDATPVVLFAPLGFYMLFSKKYMLV